MEAYHGTTRINSMLIRANGFDLEKSYRMSHSKGIYLSNSIDKCLEYGDYILKVTIDDEDVLTTAQSMIGKEVVKLGGHKVGFRELTLNRGFKALSLTDFNIVVVYDLSCIKNIKHLAR